ncbi:uncharacterized protein F5147DRAFT_656967 [Suillus discolor]|uniref:Uncharacterized protein n=1 Tax=Suillus discolor TaxID=1912936 RepID=A0A9P7EY00_9AGAM|nr:uncharacterized protein F5147DRAFT_656967 [Suillus discolor]KAG2095321.1 hypothetical protein F5147DRAFT_656967 [Suillus discolor]
MIVYVLLAIFSARLSFSLGYIGLPSSRVDVARPSSAQLNSPENRQTLASYICAIVVYFVMSMGHKAGSVYVRDEQFLCVPGVNQLCHELHKSFNSGVAALSSSWFLVVSGLVCQRVYTRSSEVRFTTKWSPIAAFTNALRDSHERVMFGFYNGRRKSRQYINATMWILSAWVYFCAYMNSMMAAVPSGGSHFRAPNLIIEFQTEGVNAIQDNFFAILDIGGTLSGVSDAGYTFGLPGIFNFNGTKYDGIVPTIEGYSCSNGVLGADGTRLGFTGGKVTVNTVPLPRKHTSVSIPQGFSRNYSMWQQGLTAKVSSNLYNSITGLRLWNITANCGANMPTTQEYVTVVNASGDADQSDSGFLPCLVCPGPSGLNQSYTSFIIDRFFSYSDSFTRIL